MGRPHIEFVQSSDVQAQPAAATGPFAGCTERVLSRDDGTLAYTALVSVPPVWRGDLSVAGRPLELFVLEGELELADHDLHLSLIHI